MYKCVSVVRGPSGWGGPLILQPTDTRNKVISVTGGGIHPIAIKVAEMMGCDVIDGFKSSVPDEQILVAVVDCAGTARCGVYPKKGLFTINITPVGKVGPLAQFIKEELYVSGVKEKCITYTDETAAVKDAPKADSGEPKTKEQARKELAKMNEGKKANIVTRIGIGVGRVVNIFFQAGRETIDLVIKNVLPFMAFTSTIIGIINATGLGDYIAKTLSPAASTIPGMIIISVVCSLPFLSPILGAGGVIAQVVGTLLGAEIGLGNIPVQYALPALFAINAQCGADFVPVGLSLGEAEPDTIELGVPAVLYSRLITGPLAVVIAFAFSVGMY